jgi:hypothetical protein
MKKSLLVGIVSLSVGIGSACGQGFVSLDNYSSAVQPLITYGAGSGGTLGAPIAGAEWTIGLYFGQGNVVVPNDPTGFAIPSDLNGLMLLGAGAGATTGLAAPGIFAATSAFQATGAAIPGQVTFMVVAYNGTSYADSDVRGHSSAFVVIPKVGTEFPPFLGDSMNAFSVVLVPEPSTLALAGIGLAGLLAFRRRS